MKIFLIKLTVLTLIIIIPFSLIEYFVERIPNEFSYKDIYMKKHSREIEILVLGASVSQYTINPAMFTKKTFILATAGQGLAIDYFFLNKFGFDSLETILLGVPFQLSLMDPVVNGSPLSNWKIYMGYDKNDISLHDFEISNLKICLNKIKNSYFLNKNMVRCDSLGSVDVDKLEIRTEEKDNAMIDGYLNDYDTNKYLKNTQYIDSITEWCKVKNVKLILFTIPVKKEYLKKMPSLLINESINFYQSKALSCENVEYYNGLYDSSYHDNDFWGSYHLFPKTGGKKFTKRMIDKYNL